MTEIIEYENGDRYEGDTEKGVPDGFGTLYFAMGGSYSGQWLKNNKDGWGILETVDGKMKVQNWHGGKLAKEYDYVEISSELGNYAGGINSLGEKEGFGIYNWKNGDEYVGEWHRGFKDGNGDYAWANGCKYSGEWKADKFNGEGTYFWADGDKYFGNWLNDMREGAGVFIDKSGKEELQEWHSGKMKISEAVDTKSKFKNMFSRKLKRNASSDAKEKE